MSTLTAPRMQIPASPTAHRRPSTGWYWFSGFLAVFGVLAALLWGGITAWDAYTSVNDFERGAIPGTVAVVVAEPGEKIVYYEGSEDPAFGELGLSVRGPNGTDVTVEPYFLDLRYDFDGQVSRAVASFDANERGRYAITAAASPELDARLAVGDDLSDAVPIVLIALSLAGVALLAAIVIAAVTYARRTP